MRGEILKVATRAVVHHRHIADARGGELVKPVAAMHDPGALGAEQRQHLRDRLDPFLAEHADDLIFGAGRIGERPEQIEDGARAELGRDWRRHGAWRRDAPAQT